MKIKLFFVLLFLPFIVLIPTAYNVTSFNVTSCEAEQGPLINYFYFLEVFFFLTLVAYLIKKIVQTPREEKKQVIFFSVGALLFMASFSGANIIGSLAAFINPANPDSWKILQYGLFGMPIFTGLLAFLIIRYKAFNIKLLGAQALVISLIILIGAEFFFIRTTTNVILTAFTLIITGVFGIALMRSVKLEVQRKDELQEMADKLSHANDELRKLDSAKSEFISIASHQLRTPLTAIKGFVSLILEGSYGKISVTVRDALNKVYQSNEHLVQLVEDLLNLSRIESGRLEYNIKDCQIADILQELKDTFLLAARQKKLDLDFEISQEKLPSAHVDGMKTREIISNLIDNAIKYTSKGRVHVKCEYDANAKLNLDYAPKGAIRVSVADTGMGIAPEDMDRLFNKFSRGKDSGRFFTNGTGLGLYVGKQMVEAQHGRISVESKGTGMGAKFVVELPVG